MSFLSTSHASPNAPRGVIVVIIVGEGVGLHGRHYSINSEFRDKQLLADSDAVFIYGDQGAIFKILLITCQNIGANLSLLSRGKTYKTNDPGMGEAKYDCQFSKILVQCHEHAALAMGKCQNFLITRVFFPVARPNHIVTG